MHNTCEALYYYAKGYTTHLQDQGGEKLNIGVKDLKDSFKEIICDIRI